MHPVLFRLPIGDWPVRLFGLFIISAFFASTLWTQWQYAKLKNEAYRNDENLARALKVMLIGLLASRVVWILVPGLGWGPKVIGVLAADFLLEGYAWFAWRKAHKQYGGDEGDFIFNLAFWLLIIGFAGSRIFWIITTPSGQQTFGNSPVRALLYIWDGGIVWYGGLLCSAFFGAWYLWVKNQKILEVGDIALVGVSLALFVGRWACFSAGDDYGKATDVAWGVTFPDIGETQIPRGLIGLAIHPTQLYMSLNGLILFLVGIFALKRKKFDGQVLWLSLILYAVGRSIIEIYRGDETRGLHRVSEDLELSSSQLISIPVFLVAGWFYLRGWLRSRGAALPDSAPPGEKTAT